MTAKYYVALTDYGASLIAQAHENSTIELVEMVLGDANNQPYEPINQVSRTSLVNQRASVPIQSVEIVDAITRISATIGAEIGGFNIHEYGYTDQTGKLVYIANYHGNYKPIISEGAGGDLEIVTDIKANAGSQNLITVNPSLVTANKKWVLDNFVTKQQNILDHTALLRLLAEKIWHVGSKHMTSQTNYDPATALEPLFGYRTTWFLWPYIPHGVENLNSPLDKIDTLQTGVGIQAKSTRIWERLTDGENPPTYYLAVNKTQVNEGEPLVFTVTTTGLIQGTEIDWIITGVLTDDITPTQTSGRFITDANGIGTYSLTVKADEVTEGIEILKLSLLNFPEVYCEVIINDSSILNESEITVNADYLGSTTQDGQFYIKRSINLYDAFTNKFSRQPRPNEIIKFNIAENVAIVADDLNTHAIIVGTQWLSSNQLILDNKGMILGFGGTAGGNYGNQIILNGVNGGDAILGGNISLNITNRNIIAGGGGGGGVGGTDVSGGGAMAGGGGGAPYGATKPIGADTPSNGGLTISGNGGTYKTAVGGKGGNIGKSADIGYQAGNSLTGSPGLAGFIFNGDVVINNVNGGQSIGR